MFTDLLYGVVGGLLYGLVGTALMMLGYLLVDVLTPGRLGRLIWMERNRNAAVILSASLLGVGGIVTTAILTSEDTLAMGLLTTAVYGVVGLVLMGIAFVVVDAITPGKLGTIVVDADLHPSAWVVASANLAVAAMVAAAIS